MSCGVRCAKVILFFINFIFVVVGVILLATGIWAAVDSWSLFQTITFFARDKTIGWSIYDDTVLVEVTAYLLIAIGVLTFLISFFGCWGVVVENRCLLVGHATILCLVLLVEVVCIILFAATQNMWEPKVRSAIIEILSKEYKGTLGARPVSEFDRFSLTMDAFMVEFKCCGLNGPDDFANTNHSQRWHTEGRQFSGEGGRIYKDDQVGLPVACCRFNDTTFMKNQMYTEYLTAMTNKMCPVVPVVDYQEKGCFAVISDLTAQHNKVLIVIPVIVLILEAIGIGLAVYLAVAIKREREAIYY